jgi:hypothetical protein
MRRRGEPIRVGGASLSRSRSIPRRVARHAPRRAQALSVTSYASCRSFLPGRTIGARAYSQSTQVVRMGRPMKARLRLRTDGRPRSLATRGAVALESSDSQDGLCHPVDEALRNAAERYCCTPIACWRCAGAGTLNARRCWNCEGLGRVWKHRLGTLSDSGLRRLGQA